MVASGTDQQIQRHARQPQPRPERHAGQQHRQRLHGDRHRRMGQRYDDLSRDGGQKREANNAERGPEDPLSETGVDWHDPTVLPMNLMDMQAVDLKNLRAAFYTESGSRPPTAETIQTVRAGAEALTDVGASIEEDRPPDVESSGDLWTRLFLADGGAWVKNLLEKLGTKEMHPSLEWTQTGKDVQASEYVRLVSRWNAFSTMTR